MRAKGGPGGMRDTARAPVTGSAKHPAMHPPSATDGLLPPGRPGCYTVHRCNRGKGCDACLRKDEVCSRDERREWRRAMSETRGAPIMQEAAGRAAPRVGDPTRVPNLDWVLG